MRRALAAAALALALAAAPAHARGPYSSHSQLHACCTPPAEADSLFRSARESGAGFIRVDVAMDGVFPRYGLGPGARDWSGLDRVAALSARYRLPVLAVLEGSPAQISSCPAAPVARRRLCTPARPDAWAAYAGELAGRYAGRIDHFEIWNEPDQRAYRIGTAAQYGRLLERTYAAIKAVAPGATVVSGGMARAGAGGRVWMRRALAATGGRRTFDVGAVHVRRSVAATRSTVRPWAAFYARRGAPLWITELGYPSDSRAQRLPGFRAGPASQAAYLSEVLPTAVAAGATQVFVTLADKPGLGPKYASEGIVGKPAFAAVREAASVWPWLLLPGSG